MRARALAEKIEITRRFREQFWSMLEVGTIKPIIDKVYPVEQAQAAHAYMRDFQNTGKIVLKVR